MTSETLTYEWTRKHLDKVAKERIKEIQPGARVSKVDWKISHGSGCLFLIISATFTYKDGRQIRKDDMMTVLL